MNVHPSSRIPTGNAHFYTGSAPRAPLDPGTTEFVKGKPPIVEQAKDMRYYRAQLARLDEGISQNARERRMVVRELKESGAWHSEFKTWKQCCREVLNVSRQRADRLIAELNELEEEDKAQTATPLALSDVVETLATVNSLPTPPTETPTQRMNRELAESMQEEKPHVVARAPVNGHKVKMGEVLENGESVMDYKRPIAPRTESGKPIHMMAIWNEVEGLYGKALNRLDEINRLSRHPVLHALTIEGTKKVMKDVSEWQEITKKSHHA